jgi:uncharacterized protein (DUF3820 family)
MSEEKTLSVGKHKHQAIGDVPDHYLVWLATRQKVTNKEDQKLAVEELKARGKDHLLPSPVKYIDPKAGS